MTPEELAARVGGILYGTAVVGMVLALITTGINNSVKAWRENNPGASMGWLWMTLMTVCAFAGGGLMVWPMLMK